MFEAINRELSSVDHGSIASMAIDQKGLLEMSDIPLAPASGRTCSRSADRRLDGNDAHRLATGKKINSALDNPVSYFTSQSLRRALPTWPRSDSVSNATQTLQAADNGITSLTKLVQSAQALGQQARRERLDQPRSTSEPLPV